MERFRDTLQKGGTPERKEEMCLLMTDEVLTYRGCRGSIRYSEADGCFYGRLKGTEDHLVYEGKTVRELMESFIEVVDRHIYGRSTEERRGVGARKEEFHDPHEAATPIVCPEREWDAMGRGEIWLCWAAEAALFYIGNEDSQRRVSDSVSDRSRGE